jgi:hypothetical protein
LSVLWLNHGTKKLQKQETKEKTKCPKFPPIKGKIGKSNILSSQSFLSKKGGESLSNKLK